MTAIAERPRLMTIEEYLEMEERSRTKHQFIKGQVFDMPGGTLKHNIISSNILTAINIAVRQNAQSFIVSNSDTKVWVPAIESFYYPDAVVICEVPEYYAGRKDVIINPLLIVEVTSPSTVDFDRSGKFLDYSTLPSFKEYLILQQDHHFAWLSNRVESDLWQLRTVEGLDQDIELKSIGCSISMRDIYFKTEDL
ncbi:MAG: Uma2 family endonuclease [Saprospiraceae bacterium]